MFPKVVALDTDWTIFSGYLNSSTWGKGRGAAERIQDNIDRVSDWEVRDRSNHNHKCHMYADVPDIIHDILKNGAKLAIVSRNVSKAMSDRALYYFKVKDGNGNTSNLISLVNYDEVYNKNKTHHFEKIKGWAKCEYTDMILFDDAAVNNDVEMMQGVTFQLVRDKKGLTWQNYRSGINMWKRNQNIESPWRGPALNNYSNKRFLGYSGMDTGTIQELESGGRRTDTKEAARWGYGMYIADDPSVAKYFAEWIKRKTGFASSIVCEVWARDADIWDKMNKIWVPDHDSLHSDVENDEASTIAQSQENRDHKVSKWGVHKPYVLFARHPNMGDKWFPGLKFPIRNHERFNEMVIYPQIQEALIVVKRMSDEGVRQAIQNQKHIHYDRKLKSWNIKVPQETWDNVAHTNDHLGR